MHTRAPITNLNTYKHEYTFLQHNSVQLNIINLSARFSVALGRFWEIPALSRRKAELKGTDERNSSPTLLAEVNIIVHPAAIAFYRRTLTTLRPRHSALTRQQQTSTSGPTNPSVAKQGAGGGTQSQV